MKEALVKVPCRPESFVTAIKVVFPLLTIKGFINVPASSVNKWHEPCSTLTTNAAYWNILTSDTRIKSVSGKTSLYHTVDGTSGKVLSLRLRKDPDYLDMDYYELPGGNYFIRFVPVLQVFTDA